MSVRVLVGDALETLKTLEAESVQCCVTSPPYFGLRQYLFDKSVVVRLDLSNEERSRIEGELIRRGISPRQGDGKVLAGYPLAKAAGVP